MVDKSLSIQLSYDNYVNNLPADIGTSAGRSAVFGSIVSSLILLNLDKGLYFGALCGVATLIRALTTPIFKEIFPSPSTLDLTTRTIAEVGRNAINLSILSTLTGTLNVATILLFAVTSATMNTVLLPELHKLIKRDLECSHPVLSYFPKGI